MSLARRVGRMVLGYFAEVRGREERVVREGEKERKALARAVARLVRGKWKMAVNVRLLLSSRSFSPLISLQY